MGAEYGEVGAKPNDNVQTANEKAVPRYRTRICYCSKGNPSQKSRRLHLQGLSYNPVCPKPKALVLARQAAQKQTKP